MVPPFNWHTLFLCVKCYKAPVGCSWFCSSSLVCAYLLMSVPLFCSSHTSAFLPCLILLSLSLQPSLLPARWCFLPTLLQHCPWTLLISTCGHAHTFSISTYYLIASFLQGTCSHLCCLASRSPQLPPVPQVPSVLCCRGKSY